jgi:hypothetical protein
MEADGLHGLSEAVNGNFVIMIEVDRLLLERDRGGVMVHLPIKLAYRTWHLYFRDCLFTFLNSWYMVTATHYNFGSNIYNKE